MEGTTIAVINHRRLPRRLWRENIPFGAELTNRKRKPHIEPLRGFWQNPELRADERVSQTAEHGNDHQHEEAEVV